MFPSIHTTLAKFFHETSSTSAFNRVVEILLYTDKILNEDDPNAKLLLHLCCEVVETAEDSHLLKMSREIAADFAKSIPKSEYKEEMSLRVTQKLCFECPFTFRTDFLSIAFNMNCDRITYINPSAMNLGFFFANLYTKSNAEMRDNNGMIVNGVLLLPQNPTELKLAKALYRKTHVYALQKFIKYKDQIHNYEKKIFDHFNDCYADKIDD